MDLDIKTNIKITDEFAILAWQWCKNNDITSEGQKTNDGFYIFKFNTEEDAIAFKMRWI